uniref:N-acetyltransferase domain-containing protein n=1 Tax=Rhizophora mucronata TaxID=61149 RepID=A0A2P2K2B5_RHIMU
MSTISIHMPEFSSFFHRSGPKYPRKFHKISACWTMTMDSGSFQTRKKEETSIQLPAGQASLVTSSETQKPPTDLRFNRLQIPEKELVRENTLEFGQFVAREAVIDEEYWTAAWLRAESHWECQTRDRYIDNYKRKFADQEFHAIKRRQTGQQGQKCRCIVTVRRQDRNVKRTVLKSVVGTLDLSIRCLLHGETFPGERPKAPLFCSFNVTSPNRYGYVANLCVAKAARRQGIAANMLQFAIDLAKSNGRQSMPVSFSKQLNYTKSTQVHPNLISIKIIYGLKV